MTQTRTALARLLVLLAIVIMPRGMVTRFYGLFEVAERLKMERIRQRAAHR